MRQLEVIETRAVTSLDYYLDHLIPALRQTNDPSEQPLPVLVMGDLECTQAIITHLRTSLPTAAITAVNEDDPAWRILAEEADPDWLTDGRRVQEKMEQCAGWRGHVLIFTARIINPIQLHILNRIALELQTPWLHATFDGPFLFIGPTFIPHRSACYECFECRIMMNLRENAGYLRYKEALVHGRSRNGEIPLEHMLCGLLASHISMEALNYLLTRSNFTINKVLAIYLPTMEFTFNELLRVPNCSACSPSALRDEEEVYFDMHTLLMADRVLPEKRLLHAHKAER